MNRTLVISIDALITADNSKTQRAASSGKNHEESILGRRYFLHLSDFDVSVPCYDYDRMLARSAWNYQ